MIAPPMGVSFSASMQVRAVSPDCFVAEGADYPWGFVYGGQTVALALRAAATTVAPERLVHSLHAYYLETGRNGDAIELSVERLRDGRSFSTRAVVARQGTATIAV